jgi:hypothetical protein
MEPPDPTERGYKDTTKVNPGRANPAISSLDVAAPGGGEDRASACLTMLSRSRAGASGTGWLAA